MNFQDLLLMPDLLRAVEQAGYQTPSLIQQKAIPPAMDGRDILGCAQTGTGKTAAFSLPILHRLAKEDAAAGVLASASRATHLPPKKAHGKYIRALILTPTRELALQIQESIAVYGRFLPYRSVVIMGGVSQNGQMQELNRGCDILVATPGRLLDFMTQGVLSLSQLSFFVLDEADRMLDMGFIHDVKKVIAKLPTKRQTMFFTATLPPEIVGLAKSLLTNPVEVAVTPVSSTVDTTRQTVYFTDKDKKPDLMSHLLTAGGLEGSTLIFTRTKYGADKLVKRLRRDGVESLAIHGDKSQGARVNALESFKSGRIRVLVATDIAARGIDIEDLNCVVNYELPNIAETYVHRIGRTGRAGKTGLAVSLCDFDEKEYLSGIEKLTRRKVEPIEDHPFPMTVFVKSPPKVPQPRPPRDARNQRFRR